MAPIAIDGSYKWGAVSVPRVSISWSNPIQTISFAKSWVFLCAMLFGATLVLVSSFTPNFSSAWAWALTTYLAAIGLFILVTAKLTYSIEDFFGGFFTIFSLIISTNAAINIFDYAQSLPNLMAYPDIRLSPDFGHVPVHFPTVGAMTYATGLAAAGGLFVIDDCWIRKTIAAVSGLILFVAICLTQSRGPLLGALVALFVMFFVSARGGWRYFLVAIPLVSFLLFLLIPKVGAFALERGDNHRFEVWRRFLGLAMQRPILGYGERLEIHLEITDGEVLGHAHNIFVSAFMRGGIIACGALLLCYILALLNASRFVSRSENAIPLGLLIVAVVAGLADFDQIIFLADWQWLSFWLPLGLAVAAEKCFRLAPLKSILR